MIHDQDLVDRLSRLHTERFEGEVFRATRIGADPTAASISGGRWAPPPQGDPGVYVLYTSLDRDGALAEVASFLAELTPIPGPRPIKVTRLAVSTARTMCLASSRSAVTRRGFGSLWRSGLRSNTADRRRPRLSRPRRPDRALGPLVLRQPYDLHRKPRPDRTARACRRGAARMAGMGRGPRTDLRLVRRASGIRTSLESSGGL